MALDGFIPEIWSARLLSHLDKDLVFKQLVNTDYEGEISNYGDTVRINQVGDVTIKDYTRNANMEDPDELGGAQQVLSIDQSKYWNVQVDDLDKAQQNPKLVDQVAARAAYAIGNTIDSYIAGFHANAGIELDNGGSGYTVGSGSGEKNAYDLVVEIGVELDENNVPAFGRWLVMPPWFHGMLLKADEYKLAFADYKAKGLIPEIAGIKILKSNNIKTASTSHYLLAGTSLAISYAGQLAKIEAYRMEKRFADGLKGLYLYGAKVVLPNALAKIVAIKGT